jgi:peptidoglycan/xylan/chitin deacetylase (PgdA/CDA1 family)
MKKTTFILIILLCLALFYPSVALADIGGSSAWAVPFIERSSEFGFLPSSFYGRYTQPITRAEFCGLAVRIFESVMDCSITVYAEFFDTDNLDVSKMAGIGVIRGTEENIFEPERDITREEAAVLLVNFMEALNRPLREGLATFSDLSSISDWAKLEVGQVQAQGIMVGLEGNIFDPKGNLTIEQSIKTMLIIYDLAIKPEREKISVNDPKIAGRRIPILMYHAIADKPTTSLTNLFLRPAELEAQLQYIAENGYQSITFEDLDNIDAYSKPIMLTFDDGYKDNYTILFPLLKKYGIRATIFVVTNTVWSEGRVSVEDIAEMSASGLVSIQSHTKNHNMLTMLGREALYDELSSSKDYLEKLTGKPVMALCYPEGAYNKMVQAAVAEYYSFAVLNSGGMFFCGGNTMAMNRIRISRGLSLGSFAAMIK